MKEITMKKKACLFAACVVFLALAGCGSINHTYLADQRFEPRPNDYPIQLIQRGAKVDREYIPLAVLSAHYLPPTRFSRIPDSFMEKIRNEARSIGGDAIIDLDIYQAPAGSVGMDSYTVQGQIVRWK
jgi:hypothetical protein